MCFGENIFQEGGQNEGIFENRNGESLTLNRLSLKKILKVVLPAEVKSRWVLKFNVGNTIK